MLVSQKQSASQVPSYFCPNLWFTYHFLPFIIFPLPSQINDVLISEEEKDLDGRAIKSLRYFDELFYIQELSNEQ